jgi:hypothetical protein
MLIEHYSRLGAYVSVEIRYEIRLIWKACLIGHLMRLLMDVGLLDLDRPKVDDGSGRAMVMRETSSNEETLMHCV